jgi:hypothetical protein
MAKLHDAWGVDSTFNEAESKYESTEQHLYERSSSMTTCQTKLTLSRELKEALREYGRLEGGRLPFNPVDCSWANVFEELRKAEDAAIISGQGDKRFLTKSRRKLTIMSKSIVPLLQALPDELCVLQGGLATIFHVRID